MGISIITVYSIFITIFTYFCEVEVVILENIIEHLVQC